MTAKDYLKQYEEAVRKESRHRAEYEKECQLIDSIKSSLGGDGMPHGSGISRKVEDQAIRLADKALEWKMAELDALHTRQEVYRLISRVPGVEGDVLYEKYIKFRTWEEIASDLCYSVRGIQYVHKRALLMVEEILLNSFHCIA